MTARKNYWLVRLSDAVEGAIAAPSEESRVAYLRLARHYCSMSELISGHDGSAELRKDGVLEAAARAGTHDFRSVHDALMEAA